MKTNSKLFRVLRKNSQISMLIHLINCGLCLLKVSKEKDSHFTLEEDIFCCVFQPANWCSIHGLLVAIIFFSNFTTFPSNARKREKMVKNQGENILCRVSTSIYVLLLNFGSHLNACRYLNAG